MFRGRSFGIFMGFSLLQSFFRFTRSRGHLRSRAGVVRYGTFSYGHSRLAIVLYRSSRRSRISPSGLSVASLGVSKVQVDIRRPIVRCLLSVIVCGFTSSFFRIVSVFRRLVLLVGPTAVGVFRRRRIGNHVLLVRGQYLGRVSVLISSNGFFSIHYFYRRVRLVSYR